MVCAICHTRRPRRFCPGVNGQICSICCGTEREVTVNCPFDCPFLHEARKHERPAPLAEDQIPNRDIRISESFLEEREPLLSAVGKTLVHAGLSTPGAVDFDIREAISSLVRTYRTMSTGLHYETVPANPVAAGIFRILQAGIADFQRAEQEDAGMQRTRDADVLGVLVFFERLELDRNNGRRRGRAFLNFLSELYPPPAGSFETGSPLLVG